MPARLEKDEYKELGILASKCSQEAFEKLYESLNQALLGYIRGKIGNLDDAKDLAQETWADCVKAKATYNPQYTFFTFLLHISKYKILDYFKRKKQKIDEMTHIVEYPELGRGHSSQKRDLSAKISEEDRFILMAPQSNITLKELLSLSFSCPAKPHQLLVLGFRILQWKPREILAELTDRKLSDLADQLVDEARKCFELNDSESAQFFLPLTRLLDEKTTAVYIEPEYQALREHYAHKTVGETRLCDYLRDDASKSLYDWMNDTRAKLRNLFLENGFNVS